MGFEIVYDEAEAARGIGLVMDGDRHRVMPDGEWIRWARRHFRKPDLFIYRHSGTQNFVLAEWLRRPERGNPVCIEIEAFPNPIDQEPSQLPADYLELRLRPQEEMKERIRRRMREANMAWIQANEKENHGRREAISHLRRMGYEFEAMKIERGELMGDWSNFGEKDDLVGDMATQASGRIITGG